MAIKVRNVGHVVLKVQDLERSARFYRDVLGLKEVARGNFGRPMACFSTGDNHHDVAVMEVGATAPRPEAGEVGLYHVALRIGTTLDDAPSAGCCAGSRTTRIRFAARRITP
jgi:catechol-2,3-dioxygenase